MAHDARSSKPAGTELAVSSPATPATVTAPSTPTARPRDIVLVHSPTEDGKGARVLRLRDQTIEAGEVRPLEDGKPIAGEVVKLTPRGDNARVCDVETLMPAPAADVSRKGPAQVATDDYRDNWGRIFGDKTPPSSRSLN